MFFCKQKNENRRKLKYLPDPEPLGASPKTPCKQLFSVLQNLLQTNVTRVIYILNVMHPAFTAAMRKAAAAFWFAIYIFQQNPKFQINLFAP